MDKREETTYSMVPTNLHIHRKARLVDLAQNLQFDLGARNFGESAFGEMGGDLAIGVRYIEFD